MSLQRTTQYGKIKINETIFAKWVLAAVSKTDGRVLCASEKGKILGGIDQKVSMGELSSNIIIKETKDSYILKFFVIMSFGASIKKNCTEILDSLESQMKKMFPDKKGQIAIKIVGVKSKKIAERSMEIVREYEIQ
ncbi:MAG: Asp23/Gls24 family envelope stress response protein [Anaerovoracaceae bacterium]